LWLLAWAALIVAASGAATGHFAWIAFAALWLFVYQRIRRAHFTPANNLIAIAVGLPMFAYLLLRSKKAHARGQVSWKGRAYDVGARSEGVRAETPAAKPLSRIESQKLRTEN
jgi:hypothetical protein